MKLLLLISLFFILPACQEEKKRARPKAKTEVKDPTEKEKKSLLNVPAGAVIEDLVLPYLDDDENKISLLTIKELTVADDAQSDGVLLEGHDLKLWLFDDEGNISSTATIPNADYLVDKEQLIAKGEVLMIGADGKFAARSQGGVFSLATGQALLIGPATSKIKIPPKKEKTTP